MTCSSSMPMHSATSTSVAPRPRAYCRAETAQSFPSSPMSFPCCQPWKPSAHMAMRKMLALSTPSIEARVSLLVELPRRAPGGYVRAARQQHDATWRDLDVGVSVDEHDLTQVPIEVSTELRPSPASCRRGWSRTAHAAPPT